MTFTDSMGMGIDYDPADALPIEVSRGSGRTKTKNRA